MEKQYPFLGQGAECADLFGESTDLLGLTLEAYGFLGGVIFF